MTRMESGPRRWPLALIAAPAAVAIWSGWVGLGGMAGFGMVAPLPGIVDSFRLNTAITLPVGVEAYGAYALGAWLHPGTPAAARTFARRSALGALALGMAGQVIYHLLAAAHATRAPWPVVVLVACLPVVTLGFGAALTHLLRADETAPEAVTGTGPAGDPGPVTEAIPDRVPEAIPAPGPDRLPEAIPDRPRKAIPDRSRKPISGRAGTRSRPPVTAEDAEREFAPELAYGTVPSIRQIRTRLHVGYDRAVRLREHMEKALTGADGHHESEVAEAGEEVTK